MEPRLALMSDAGTVGVVIFEGHSSALLTIQTT